MAPLRLGRYRMPSAGSATDFECSTGGGRGSRGSAGADHGLVRNRPAVSAASTQAIEWCRGGIADAERSGAQDALAHAYFILDWAHVALGRLDEAGLLGSGGRDLRRARRPRPAGLGAQQHGRPRLPRRTLERNARARRACTKDVQADRRRESGVDAGLNIAEIRSDQGRMDEAEPLFREVLEVRRVGRQPAQDRRGRVAPRPPPRADGRARRGTGCYSRSRGSSSQRRATKRTC